MVIVGETIIIGSVLCFALAPQFPFVLLGRAFTGFGVGICGLAKPLIVMRRASILCVIRALGVDCILLNGTLYVISSMVERKREEATST